MISVIGGGTIGVGWAIVFARSGLDVSLFEPDEVRRRQVVGEIERRLVELAEYGLIDEPPSLVAGRVATFNDLRAAVGGAIHVQECAPESLDIKRRLFSEMFQVADRTTTFGSSSSAMIISDIATDESAVARSRSMVVHPGNPPYLIRVVEVVPAPFTADESVEVVVTLLTSAGMVPVRVNTEIEGFVFNRLQGALLREAYCLVRDGVATPEAIDVVVTEGLGRRWSVVGPFATAELNTRGGVRSHAEKMGPAYARMGAERGQDNPWDSELVERVAEYLESKYPSAYWEDHVIERDRALMRQEAARRQLQQQQRKDVS